MVRHITEFESNRQFAVVNLFSQMISRNTVFAFKTTAKNVCLFNVSVVVRVSNKLKFLLLSELSAVDFNYSYTFFLMHRPEDIEDAFNRVYHSFCNTCIFYFVGFFIYLH